MKKSLLIHFLMLGPLTLLRAWVAQLCWSWFVVPTFNLPALSLGQCIGLTLTIGIFALTPDWPSDDEDADTKELILHTFYPLTVLLMGWIVKLIM